MAKSFPEDFPGYLRLWEEVRRLLTVMGPLSTSELADQLWYRPVAQRPMTFTSRDQCSKRVNNIMSWARREHEVTGRLTRYAGRNQYVYEL